MRHHHEVKNCSIFNFFSWFLNLGPQVHPLCVGSERNVDRTIKNPSIWWQLFFGMNIHFIGDLVWFSFFSWLFPFNNLVSNPIALVEFHSSYVIIRNGSFSVSQLNFGCQCLVLDIFVSVMREEPINRIYSRSKNVLMAFRCAFASIRCKLTYCIAPIRSSNSFRLDHWWFQQIAQVALKWTIARYKVHGLISIL